MGLIRAAISAVGGTMADQWKEFFICESLDADVLAVKGQKRIGSRSANKKGSDNLITSGSGIAVADGQCALIVEQGKIVEVCAEPGEYTYDASTEPTIFSGNLGSSLDQVFDVIGKRFTYGGDTGKDQRIYYINTKELIDNKFGTPNPASVPCSRQKYRSGRRCISAVQRSLFLQDIKSTSVLRKCMWKYRAGIQKRRAGSSA